MWLDHIYLATELYIAAELEDILFEIWCHSPRKSCKNNETSMSSTHSKSNFSYLLMHNRSFCIWWLKYETQFFCIWWLKYETQFFKWGLDLLPSILWSGKPSFPDQIKVKINYDWQKHVVENESVFLWRSHHRFLYTLRKPWWLNGLLGYMGLFHCASRNSSKCSRHEWNLLLLDLESRGSWVNGWNQVVFMTICLSPQYLNI